MKNSFLAAAAQISPVYMALGPTVEKVCGAIAEAAARGAALVVFPEVVIPGYPYWRGLYPISEWTEWMVRYQDNSLRIPSEETDKLCEAARQAHCFCVIGCSERSGRPGSETLYNTILFINEEGTILGRHRKLMPTHGERMVWGMGDGSDLQVFETSLGRIGGLICYLVLPDYRLRRATGLGPLQRRRGAGAVRRVRGSREAVVSLRRPRRVFIPVRGAGPLPAESRPARA